MRHAGREGGRRRERGRWFRRGYGRRRRGVKTAGGERGADAREGREYFLTPI